MGTPYGLSNRRGTATLCESRPAEQGFKSGGPDPWLAERIRLDSNSGEVITHRISRLRDETLPD
jgi:hypothetical protein